jgi:hypothetical protein
MAAKMRTFDRLEMRARASAGEAAPFAFALRIMSRILFAWLTSGLAIQ